MNGLEGSIESTRDLALGLAQLRGEGADQGALADPGRAGEADDPRLAGARDRPRATSSQPAGSSVLDQGDRPRQGALVAGDEALGERSRRLFGGVGASVRASLESGAAVIRACSASSPRNGMLNRRATRGCCWRYLWRRAA